MSNNASHGWHIAVIYFQFMFETNHVIGWGWAKVIGTEQNIYKRWIKGAIEIRKRGNNTIGRDKGQYFISHVYDGLLNKSPARKSTGNSKDNDQNIVECQSIPVLKKSTGVPETSTTTVSVHFGSVI